MTSHRKTTKGRARARAEERTWAEQEARDFVNAATFLLEQARADQRLTPLDRRLLAMVIHAGRRDASTNTVRIDAKTLAAELPASLTGVSKMVKRLRRLGYIGRPLAVPTAAPEMRAGH